MKKLFALSIVLLCAGCASGRFNTTYAEDSFNGVNYHRVPSSGGKYVSPHTF